MASRVGVHAKVDTRELRNDLEAIEGGLGTRELSGLWHRALGPLAAETRRRTPFDPEHREDRADGLPHIRDTIAPHVTAVTASIASDHPAAPVFEHGGHIEPQGARIDIPAVHMASKAFDAKAHRVEAIADDFVTRLLRKHNLA